MLIGCRKGLGGDWFAKVGSANPGSEIFGEFLKFSDLAKLVQFRIEYSAFGAKDTLREAIKNTHKTH